MEVLSANYDIRAGVSHGNHLVDSCMPFDARDIILFVKLLMAAVRTLYISLLAVSAAVFDGFDGSRWDFLTDSSPTTVTAKRITLYSRRCLLWYGAG